MKPVVAIVGRPNVGKSTLFNRLIGRTQAVVEDFPGTTRDRLYGEVDWNGKQFDLVDSGGVTTDQGDNLTQSMNHQVKQAITESDVVLFVIDGKAGVTHDDETALNWVRKSKKKVLLVVNKVDGKKQQDQLAEYYNLGLGDPRPVSAVNGSGTGDLLDAVTLLLQQDHAAEETVAEETGSDQGRIKIAFIGRPNVGKSTLVNQILKSDRMVASEIPGTTRDAVDIDFELEGRAITLIDTAGIRRRGKIEQGIEKYSVIRSHNAINRAHVVCVLFDPVEGLTKQDMHIVGYAIEAGKGIVIACNKWDLAKLKADEMGIRRDELLKTYQDSLREALNFVDYAPFITLSALHGTRVEKLVETALYVYDQGGLELTDKQLRTIWQPLIARTPAPTKRGISLHVHRYTQTGSRPPTFQFVVNEPKTVHFSFQRALDNALRTVYPFSGNPIRFTFEKRNQS